MEKTTNELLCFEGKTALITGAAVGIGRAAALELARQGASLVLLDIDEEKLNDVKSALAEYNTDVLIYKCDISDEARVNEVVADALEKFKTIHILVNNAALWRMRSAFAEMDMGEWRRYFDINVNGTAYVTKAVLPNMLENGYGRIINVASVAGVYGIANMVPYSMTKGAIISFTVALAKEVTGHGVLVNAVSPGNIQPPEDGLNLPALSFANRSGTPEECAEVICFLASDEASYVSGQNYLVDGCRKKM